MISVIIDSSVVGKWFFPSEEDSKSAFKIKDDFSHKQINISVPVLIYYEINNLLKTAIKSLRVDQKKAKLAYQGFLNLNFTVYSAKELLKLTLEKAVRLDISSYDASYIALAEVLDVPFYTADERLVLKAKDKLVKDLKEYRQQCQFS